MPLVAIGTELFYGYQPFTMGTVLAFNTAGVLDADGDRVGLVFGVPDAISVAKVSVGLGTITTGSTGLRVTIETLTAAGIPSGTLYHANATVDIAVADTDDDIWKGDNAFGGAFTITDLVALVVKRIPANTFNGIIGRMAGGVAGELPYSIQNLTGSTTKSPLGVRAGLELADGSKYFIPGLLPFSATAVTAFSSASTPDEKGMQFRFPARARVVGMWWHGALTADTGAAVTYAASLYEGTTSRASRAVDNDVCQTNTEGFHRVYFTAPHTIVANTDYIVAIAPGTVNAAIREYTLPAAAWMNATAFRNLNALGATRTDAGAWTTAGATYRLCGPIIDQIDGGHPLVHAGMTGGMRA